jgi:hypothetical protein
MDAHIPKALDRRYCEYLDAVTVASTAISHHEESITVDYQAHPPLSSAAMLDKLILDLLLQGFLSDNPPPPLAPPPPGSSSRPAGNRDTRAAVADPVFRAFATSMLRSFVLAGTGASSSAMCYVLHLLAAHPVALARVSAEHDAVLGRDLARLPQQLATEPQRLGALPYTDAAIKKSLRLYPPATAGRQGAPAPDGLLCVGDNDNGDGGTAAAADHPQHGARLRCYPNQSREHLAARPHAPDAGQPGARAWPTSCPSAGWSGRRRRRTAAPTPTLTPTPTPTLLRPLGSRHAAAWRPFVGMFGMVFGHVLNPGWLL